MNINKIIGYTLLFVGILLIIVPLWQTYLIFTGQTMPMQVFKEQKITTTAPNNPLDVQQQMQKALTNVLPMDAINNTLNLATWIMFMWILIFGGGKLAGLGIQLVKD